jgi:hypothetical protein
VVSVGFLDGPRARWLAFGLLSGGMVSCGTLLGIGDPSLEEEGGTDGGLDSTMVVDGRGDVKAEAESSADVVVEAAEAGDAGDGGPACPTGQTPCSGEAGTTCADLTSDPANCHACGSACPVGNNTPSCSGGVCGLGTCNTNFEDCDQDASNGCESNQNTDTNNCGSCGHGCTGGELCAQGKCSIGCSTGQTACYRTGDGGLTETPTTFGGYCTTLTSDTQNCGACGNVCPSINDSTQCNGTCGVLQCTPGFADCDTDASNGCEINTTNDPKNCGGCNVGCAASCVNHVSGVSCSGSTCAITGCMPGFSDFNGACGDGCECATNPATTCATASFISLTGPGTPGTTASGTLAAGGDAWYQVNFTGNTAPNYHPFVSLTTNPGSEFVFDVLSSCSGGTPVGCMDSPGAGLSTWEIAYATFPAGQGPFSSPNGQPGQFIGTTSALIHLYRASGAPPDCQQYTLTFQN